MTEFFNKETRVIAHRGASAYAPENTLSAFTKAAQLGIKWIEFDVMASADGVPIIFHDEKLNRTTNGKGNVEDFSYDFLQTLDAGRWFNAKFSDERIPSLTQVVEFLCNTNLSANVELKVSPSRGENIFKRILTELSFCLENKKCHILFSSFSFEALTMLRKISSDCHIGMLLDRWNPHWEKLATELNCTSVHLNHRIMTPDIAKEIKATNRWLLCYTVNNPQRAQVLYHWGVDAVFSDVPDKIK